MKIKKLFRKIFQLSLVFFVSSQIFGQELTLFTMPPPKSLDWSSPRSLMFGAAVVNRFTFSHIKHKHTFGHVFIELKGANGEREVAGSTTAPDAPSDADFITKKGYGLGVFWANFKGALDTQESLDPQIADRYKSGRIGFISFKLNQKQHERLKTYLREYRQRGYEKVYNGLNRPREGLGAGCSIFGISFLEVIGLIKPDFEKDWVISVRVPTKLIGGPGTGKHVSPLSALFGRWAKENEPHRVLSLYDPDLIFLWIHKIWEREKFRKLHSSQEKIPFDYFGTLRLARRGKALGLSFDCSNMDVPAEPIWKNQN